VGYLSANESAVETRSPSREFAKDAEQVLQELFFDPKASREYARDAYLVQAGNIYVNQVSPEPVPSDDHDLPHRL
jgi:hypothetical protein